MPVAEYPMLSVSSSNPRPLIFYQFPVDYQVGFTEYADGGRDYLQQSGGGVRRWYIFYDGLTFAQAAVLDAHADSAKIGEGGSANTFNFRDRDTTTLYSGVRYEKFERPAHKLKDIQSRTVILVKYP